MGRIHDVLQFRHITRVISHCFPVAIGIWQDDVALHVIVICIYWLRLFDFNYSENLQTMLLPISRLVLGLAPASMVALIGFCGVTHSLFVMEEQPLWPHIFYKSFNMLITAALPSPTTDTFRLIFSYIAVLAFAVFFLNIFIGVISEDYSSEKASYARSYEEVRAVQCLAYLTRVKVIPCAALSKYQGYFGVLLTWVVALLLAMVSKKDGFMFNLDQQQMVIAYFSTLVTMFFCAYQNPNASWAQAEDKNYLWLAYPPPEQETDEITDLHGKVEEMQMQLSHLQMKFDRFARFAVRGATASVGGPNGPENRNSLKV
jgi:hypothetical protein